MTHPEHTPKTPSLRTGVFAVLANAFRAGATRAPSPTRSAKKALLSLPALVLAFFAFGVAPALAAPETPEVGVLSFDTTEMYAIGVVNPRSTPVSPEPGTYQFVYRPSSEAEDKCQGSGEVRVPASPGGTYFGVSREEVFFETIAGLTPGAGYAVCLRVENTAHEVAVSTPEYRELPFPPITPETPEVQPANPVGTTTATFNGTLNPNAAREREPGAAEFLYRRSATECENEQSVAVAGPLAGKQAEAVKAAVTGLEPNTTYTFCLRETNNNSEAALSAPETFTTPVAPPSFPEASVTEVTSSSATLHAEVDPGGLATTYAFEYAPAGSADFKPVLEPKGHGAGTLPQGGSPVPVEVHLSEGLEASTAYEFRLTASHAGSEQRSSVPVSFTTQGAGSFALPDGRAWELVSPPDKHGADIETLGGIGQAYAHLSASSPSGSAFTYSASAPTEADVSGYTGSVQVLSTRTSTGWVSTDLSAEHANQQTALGGTKEYPLFSEDLSHAALNPLGAFVPALSGAATEQTPYLRTNFQSPGSGQFCTAGCYQPLVTSASVAPGTIFGLASNGNGNTCPSESSCGPALIGANSDLSDVVLQSNTSFEPGAPSGELYEWSAATGQLLPVSVLPDGEPVGVEAQVSLGAEASTEARHAISDDGSRVLFTTGGSEHPRLYLRDVSRGETVELGADFGGVGAFFQLASSDGSRIFYTSGRGEAGDLYEFEVTSGPDEPLAGRETDLTPGASVQANVIGASKDGSYLYFVADGQLAPGAVAGTCSQAYNLILQTQCNLYEWHEGAVSLVAVLSGNDWPDWTGEGPIEKGLAALTARVSPDGRYLAFMSERPLTGYDTDDARTGRPDEEVYLYHAPTENGAPASATLTCASCDPTGARPVGIESIEKMIPGIDGQEPGWKVGASSFNQPPQGLAGSVPGWQTPFNSHRATYQSRYLSDNGRLFFNATDALVPADVNGTGDVYEYEPEGVPSGVHACSSASTSGSDVFEPARTFRVPAQGAVPAHEVQSGAGCVALISSGVSPQESAFLDASAGHGEGEHGEASSVAGANVFFLTAERLVPADFDNSYDVYDAHECTTAAPCPPAAGETPPACTTTDACRAAQTPQPGVFGAPPSATFTGPGDTPAPPTIVVKPKPKVVKCRKGFVNNKQGKCTKRKKSKKAKKSAHTNRRTHS